MFPHTITLYHHSIVNNADIYHKSVINGVYWQETQGIQQVGHARQNSNSVTITVDRKALPPIDKPLTWCDGDKVVKGVGADITKFADIPNAFTITSITDNRVNSDVDNVIIQAV